MSVNPYMTAETKGLAPLITFAGTNKEKIQQVIDLIAQESTQTQRGHLDMIPPLAQRALYAMLVNLKATVVDV